MNDQEEEILFATIDPSLTDAQADQLVLDAMAQMDEKIIQLKATVRFAELCMRKYRDAWALLQKTRATPCQP